MKFGFLEDTTGIDFSLPHLNDHSLQFLQEQRTDGPFKVHIGGSKWGIKQYVGSVYPKGTKAGDYLEHYSNFFSSIELNASGYGLRMLDSIEKWLDKVPNGFTFSPKFPRTVSHYQRLTGTAIDSAHAFFERINDFGPHLGVPFLQMTDTFAPASIDNLEHFVHEMSDTMPYAIELRNEGWYGALTDEITAILRAHNVAWVMTDTPGRRDALHGMITAPRLFVRFVSSLDPITDKQRLDDWLVYIATLRKHGLKEVCFYFHAKEPLLVPQYYGYLQDGITTNFTD